MPRTGPGTTLSWPCVEEELQLPVGERGEENREEPEERERRERREGGGERERVREGERKRGRESERERLLLWLAVALWRASFDWHLRRACSMCDGEHARSVFVFVFSTAACEVPAI